MWNHFLKFNKHKRLWNQFLRLQKQKSLWNFEILKLNLNLNFEFWTFEFGVWSLDFEIVFWILVWILNLEFSYWIVILNMNFESELEFWNPDYAQCCETLCMQLSCFTIICDFQGKKLQAYKSKLMQIVRCHTNQ